MCDRTEQITKRCKSASWNILPNGDVLDPDIPYLLAQLEASQKNAKEVEQRLLNILVDKEKHIAKLQAENERLREALRVVVRQAVKYGFELTLSDEGGNK